MTLKRVDFESKIKMSPVGGGGGGEWKSVTYYLNGGTSYLNKKYEK
jgi:hypothetical protein